MTQQVAVVTGAGGGYGREVAVALAAAGARVVAADRLEQASALEATVERITKANGSAVSVSADLSTMSGGDAVVRKAVEEYGALDVLFCASSVTRDASILDISVADWDATIAGTLKSAFVCVRDAAVVMRQQRSGRIILTTSGLGLGRLADSSGLVASTAATAGIAGIVRVVYRDMARYGVAVNAIDTDMVTGGYNRDSAWTPPGEESSKPEEATALAVYLALNEAAAQVTGETFFVSKERIGVYSRYRQDITESRAGGWNLEQVKQHFATLDAGERLAHVAVPGPNLVNAR